MTNPPSRWSDRLLGFAFRLLAVVVMLYLVARLVVALLPVLIAVAVVGAVVYIGWSAYQYWRGGRW